MSTLKWNLFLRFIDRKKWLLKWFTRGKLQTTNIVKTLWWFQIISRWDGESGVLETLILIAASNQRSSTHCRSSLVSSWYSMRDLKMKSFKWGLYYLRCLLSLTLKKEVNNCALLWKPGPDGEISSHAAVTENPWPHFRVVGSVVLLDMLLCTHFPFLIKIEQLWGACRSLISVSWNVNAFIKCEAFGPASFSLLLKLVWA